MCHVTALPSVAIALVGKRGGRFLQNKGVEAGALRINRCRESGNTGTYHNHLFHSAKIVGLQKKRKNIILPATQNNAPI